ncbi:MAG: 3-isopropylmalate dehydratase large subunit [Rhodospirillales bacterium 69-11]|nr:3-isopropylmalate dehydratase large subunit [Rhodospirillales bacterium]OJW27467.1 MAG: 3-isopropylmalate dehydratase large subunit [Rhodospirillales bacterium 69-11]
MTAPQATPGSETSTAPRTLFEKVWASHAILTREDGTALLWIDRHFVHEGSFHGFGMLEHSGRPLARPDLTIAVADHYVPSHARTEPIRDPEVAGMITTLRRNAERHGVDLLDLDDPRQGIVHVIGPEQGLTLPGLTVVCGDSHTSTHGAFGALAFGIGASEVSHVLATQTLWQRRPKTMRITVDGTLSPHVAGKDVILAIIGRIGAGGAVGHVIEYAGSAIRSLPMEGRLTVCNMSIEAGARAGMIAPDETTFAWVEGRPRAPKSDAFAAAVAAWRRLPTEEGARFDRDVVLDAAEIAPTVTWGTSPETALPVTGVVPDPATATDAAKRARIADQLDYMGLAPGRPLEGIPVDRVFIGSCTNARLPDLRAAAAVLRGQRAVVPGLVVAGSVPVKRAAEAEGLDRVFRDAGLTWGEPGCSMCVGMNGDLVKPGERCAATSNRNFQGRQGPGARTHLMSPAMAAAAALRGAITDVRRVA